MGGRALIEDIKVRVQRSDVRMDQTKREPSVRTFRSGVAGQLR